MHFNGANALAAAKEAPRELGLQDDEEETTREQAIADFKAQWLAS
jgi:hypothetical protein